MVVRKSAGDAEAAVRHVSSLQRPGDLSVVLAGGQGLRLGVSSTTSRLAGEVL
jgi:hypothetical protein